MGKIWAALNDQPDV